MMKKKPKLSIILTSYNHEKYLREAIDSTLNQTFTDFELIILDDNSSDNSWEIINNYKDVRIKTFCSDESGQVVFRVNNAITNLAEGDYIAIHHSDDVWGLDKLEKQVAFLDAHPEIGAVFTNAQAIGEDSLLFKDENHFYTNIFNQPNRTRHEWLRFFFSNGNALCHPSILIRKECYESCGLYRFDMAQLPDFEMWIRLCNKYEIHVLPEKLVKFRVRGNEANASGSRPETRIRSTYEYYKVLQFYRGIVSKDNIFKIFPDYVSDDRENNTDAEYVLARICLEPESFFIKQLLGIEILFDIVNDIKRKNIIEQYYDFSIRDFIGLTGKYDIFSHEVVADLTSKNIHLNEENALAKKENALAKKEAAEDKEQIAKLNQALTKLKTQIDGLNQIIAKRDLQVSRLRKSIASIRESTSWRITAPLRTIVLAKCKIQRILSDLPKRLRQGEGLLTAYRGILQEIENEAAKGSKKGDLFSNQLPILVADEPNKPKITIVPYYIDPKLDLETAVAKKKASIAIHLHLFYTEMLDEFVSYLNNMPVQYDLYISVPENCDIKDIFSQFNNLLTKVKSVTIESAPNRGRNIAPFIIQFGKRLAKYEIIAHIHTKKCLKGNQLTVGCADTLNNLFGLPGSKSGRITHILGLLQATAKLVFSEVRSENIDKNKGWLGNYKLAKNFLEKNTGFAIGDYLDIEAIEDGMFWSRSECLLDFLRLPLKYDDFPIEPIAADGTLVNALKRMILIFASNKEGQYLCIHKGDSIKDYRQYEEQQDYSSKVIHTDIKVMSYYLPQFHPIPENDLWHGKGFTEWTKVRAANPLFEGHYQQHIPHSDIGYYLLDSMDTLKRQSEMMEKAGVYGQVFYHYWFSGKLILEEPAQLLLNSPDINMPFCFCWANENWTRRWDGNENEILLGQDYSVQDAHDFIHYIIPFFKDPRYIKLEDRPMLFIYRPSSIPNSQEYLDVWANECSKAGLKQPYVVAVLTRSAANPKDFGMDAGVERVLHDWTGGSVPEINQTLNSYQPINGSILPYHEVADFYMAQKEAKDFTYFRSLIPIFDNTARYGADAYITHGSMPQRFQEWMGSSVAFTQANLPPDRRFILINAWNEWAEGAHLEPDSRYGYSYLNSIGRALSGISYTGELNPSCTIPTHTKVHLSFSKQTLNALKKDIDLKQQFIHCLSQSSIFNLCSVSINNAEIAADLPRAALSDPGKADFILEFRNVVLFDALALENMVMSASAFGLPVIANSYGGNFSLIEVAVNNSVHAHIGFTAPLIILPKALAETGYKAIKMRTDARCFVAYPSQKTNKKKPLVTTIIRYHKAADHNELKNALYCLSAMTDCIVIPFIAAQDLSKHHVEELKNTLNEFAWTQGNEPNIELYQSQNGNTDIRSKMLNESLKKVKTRYAAILDYDDLLMPHAYSWLINRLEKTGKAVAFGRVYNTSYDSSTGLLLERNRMFEYNYSYEEFIGMNHAPIHSIMLDMERLDFSDIVYYDDQRYMEDYLLTLQLFTEDNCDWDSLKENFYIGDYIHSVDRSHTLAFSSTEERQALLSNPEYLVCEQRISNMRKLIQERNSNLVQA